MPRRAAIIKEIRSRHEAVVLVDAGDLFDLRSNPVKHRYVIRGMDRMRYDAVNIGDQEMTEGAGFLLDQMQETALPLVSATMTAETDTWDTGVPPFRIIEKDGLRLAIIGSGPAASYRFLTEAQRSGLSIAEDYEPLKRQVEALREQCDLIIVLAHAGLEDNKTLARTVDDIDLIVGAHTQIRTDEPVRVGRTHIVQAGKNSEHIGMLSVKIRDEQIREAVNELIPLDNKVSADPDMQALVDEYMVYLKKRRTEVLGPPVPPIAECARCHTAQTAQWQTTRHAHAFETLVQQKKTDNPECLTCHVTTGGRNEDSIQCLTCHVTPRFHGQSGAATQVSAVTENLCQTCHTRIQSPEFDFEARRSLVRH